ncbi:MAG: tetratricopeptide repeat protein [Candidatus Nitronauta litoralis]|uniref:Tetratricopeptide repeat protein n=1 Tax=Candidatus Nitronauta litoralis TaxID=2705533 RepID=A0A7T0BZW6_9BACT|nr:MAG: tetratricopeptide repeat protein [Candidatus Nitronauta litoralis]
MLTLVFGHTVYSVSVVLSAFMAGLGFGSYVFGHAMDRLINQQDAGKEPLAALKTYAFIELSIGIMAAGLSVLFAEFDFIYGWMHNWLPESPLVLDGLKAVLSFGLIFLPTALMGATLPIISRYYVTDNSRMNTQVGLLYSLNTLGAAAGCLLTGFFFIASFGVLETALAAAALNLAIGVGTWRLYQERAEGKNGTIQFPRLTLPKLKWTKDSQLWLLVSFVCGFTALAYEVLWTRLLVFSISSTVYAFSLMLAVFLVGISLGSGLAVPIMNRVQNLRTPLLMIQGLVGFYSLLTLFNMQKILSPPWNSYNLEKPLNTFSTYFFDSAALMLPPTLLLGMSFPILIKLAAGDQKNIGVGTGQIYAANTLGAILGSLVAGFFLLPGFGVEASLVLVATLNLLMVPVLFRTGSYATHKMRRVLTIGMAALILLMNLALPDQMLTGFFMRDSTGNRDVKHLLHFSEGITDTVAVFQDPLGQVEPNAKRLITNGISMSASNKIASRYMKLLAHVPVLLSDNPDEVLVICFGTGQTAGAAGLHPRVGQVDVVELSKSVIEAGSAFRQENHNVLQNPKVNIIIQDGRNHLLTTRKQYDVITGEPPPPRTAFTVNLYTQDYYEMARARLKPGGLMVQWVPLHSQSAAEVDQNFATFLSVFPHTIAFLTVANEIMLVGSDQPIELDFKKLQQRMNDPVIKLALDSLYIENAQALLSNIWFFEEDLHRLSENQSLITDNHPSLEFYLDKGPVIGVASQERLIFNRTPGETILSRIRNMDRENRQRFKDYFKAMDFYQRGVMYGNRKILLEAINLVENDELIRYHLQAGTEQVARLLAAIEEDPENLEAMVELGHAWYQLGEYEKSAMILRRVRERVPDNPAAMLYLGYNMMELGQYEGAQKLLKEATRKDPRQMRSVLQQIAFIQLLQQQSKSPDDTGLLLATAQFYNMREDYTRALEFSKKVLDSDQLHEKALQSAMFSYRGLGRPRDVLALGAHYKLVNPDDITYQYLMAEMLAKTLQCDKAIPYFEKVIEKDDTYRKALKMLRDCKRILEKSGVSEGKSREAA